MSWLSSIRSAFGLKPAERPHKGLAHADATVADRTAIDAVIWVLIDEAGNYVADADPTNLDDEYAYQVGRPTLGVPVQLVRLTARVPLPRPIELQVAMGRE